MTRNSGAALVAAIVLMLVSASAVSAHAELVETNPPDGGTISTPFTVTGTFSEPLVGNSNVVVRNSAGDSVAQGEVAADDAAVMVAELPVVPPGEYRARWTASTADGHTERFTTTFIVVAASPTSPPPTAAPQTPAPTASATAATPGPSVAPTQTPIPSATPSPTPPESPPPPAGTDVLLALGLAAVALLVLGIFIFTRQRR